MARLVLGGVSLFFLANWVICCGGGTSAPSTARRPVPEYSREVISPEPPAAEPEVDVAKPPEKQASGSIDLDSPSPKAEEKPAVEPPEKKPVLPEEVAAKEANDLMDKLTIVDAKYLALTDKSPNYKFDIGNFITVSRYYAKQVVGANELLAKVGNATVLMMMNTSSVVDGRYYVPRSKVWFVPKTARYETVLGATKQVYVLIPVNTELVDQVLKKINAARQLNQERLDKAEYERTRWRTFSDASGTFKIVAEFKKFIGGKVHLLRKDNREEIELEMSQLSEADQNWIRDKFRR